MVDHLSKEKRSRLMAKIRSTDTGPERAVRSILHRLGYRFRIHRKDLPGSPDIVMPRYRTVILVHGCFCPALGAALGGPLSGAALGVKPYTIN